MVIRTILEVAVSTKITRKAGLRFTAISMLLTKLESRAIARAAICEVVSYMEDYHQFAVSEKTLYRWLQRYRAEGWKAIEDQKRQVPGRALSKEFLEFLSKEKKKDPFASIPEIILRARYAGVVSQHCAIDRTTVYRAAIRLNLPFYKNVAEKNVARPFAYKHRMQMVLCDGKHFKVNGKKRVAFFFLDDATRHILAVKVGASETTHMFLTGLYQVIQNYGLMERIYMDHGSAFTAKHVAAVGLRLDIPILFGKVAYPQGRGKIERFNRTVSAGCLRGLDKPDIDSEFAALELRINHYLENFYSINKHSDLRCSPSQAFFNDSRTLLMPSNWKELNKHFCIEETRKVTADNCIKFNSKSYEAPLGHAGTKALVRYQLLEQKLYLVLEEGEIALHLVDKNANAKKRRANTEPHSNPADEPVTTAAELAYNKDFRSIVTSDGGYSIKSEYKDSP